MPTTTIIVLHRNTMLDYDCVLASSLQQQPKVRIKSWSPEPKGGIYLIKCGTVLHQNIALMWLKRIAKRRIRCNPKHICKTGNKNNLQIFNQVRIMLCVATNEKRTIEQIKVKETNKSLTKLQTLLQTLSKSLKFS